MGETGGPSQNTLHMMDRAREAAVTIEADVGSVMAAAVAEYRAALQAAGYTPFGIGR